MIDEVRPKLAALAGSPLAGSTVSSAEDFHYIDPVDHSESLNAGICIRLSAGDRIVCRLSGTGTEGATRRLYLERYSREIGADPATVLKPLAEAGRDLLGLAQRFGRDEPSVIT